MLHKLSAYQEKHVKIHPVPPKLLKKLQVSSDFLQVSILQSEPQSLQVNITIVFKKGEKNVKENYVSKYIKNYIEDIRAVHI